MPYIILDFCYLLFVVAVLLSDSLNRQKQMFKRCKILKYLDCFFRVIYLCNETNPISPGLNAKQPRVQGQEPTNIGDIWSHEIKFKKS